MKKRRMIVRILAVLVAILMVATTFAWMFAWGAETVYGATTLAGGGKDKLTDADLDKIRNVMEILHDSYKDKVKYETLIDGALDGIAASLNDDYTVYYRTADDKSGFTTVVAHKYGGIGVTLTAHEKGALVKAVTEGGPAEGILEAGDIITAAAGKSFAGLSLDEIVTYTRGDAGTKVTVSILRGGAAKSVTITRALLDSPAVSSGIINGTTVGYIDISIMDSDVSKEFGSAVDSLKAEGATCFIIDLRDNGGGYTAQAVDMADRVLRSGEIVGFSSRGEEIVRYSAKGDRYISEPIVILVNEKTASASEIFTSALKENNRAKVVGTVTFGKGIGQAIVDIDDESSLKLSTLYFKGPHDKEIQGVGIAPDYEVHNYSVTEMTDMLDEIAGFAPVRDGTKPVLGSTGLAVYGSQQRLALMGYDTGVTGTMDDRTVAAVKAFQKDSGLYSYGCLDFTTQNKIEETCAAYPKLLTSTDFQLQKALEVLGF